MYIVQKIAERVLGDINSFLAICTPRRIKVYVRCHTMKQFSLFKMKDRLIDLVYVE